MDTRTFQSPGEAVAWALRFEAGLGLAAILGGVLMGYPALAALQRPAGAAVGHDLILGTLATLPLLGILLVCELYPVGPLRSLQHMMDSKVLQIFRGASLDQLALVAFAAGLGEELLFRGVLQVALIDWLGLWWGIGLAAVVFGICHYISHAYALFAAAIGLYLGLLFYWTGNLLAPIVTHALYDFIALAYLLKCRRESSIDLVG